MKKSRDERAIEHMLERTRAVNTLIFRELFYLALSDIALRHDAKISAKKKPKKGKKK